MRVERTERGLIHPRARGGGTSRRKPPRLRDRIILARGEATRARGGHACAAAVHPRAREKTSR